MLGEVMAAGHRPMMTFATPEWPERAETDPEIAGLLDSLPEPPTLVEARLLHELADADSPRGLVAVVELPRGGIEAIPKIRGEVVVYADAIQDPGNLGALARSAEASGALALALGPGCAHPNHPRALRAAAGSLFRFPVARGVAPDALDGLVEATEGDLQWLALATRDGESIWEAPLTGTLIVAVGAEGKGLSEAVEQRATRALTIPLSAPVESLNATVAASLVLFEIRRRRSG